MLLGMGAACYHGRMSNGAVTHANSADIACRPASEASSGAPLDAGNWSKASSPQGLSLPNIQYQQGADDFCAYHGWASALLCFNLFVLHVLWPHYWIWMDPRAAAHQVRLLSEGFIRSVDLPHGDLRKSSAGPAEDGLGAGPPALRAAPSAGQGRGCSTSILPRHSTPWAMYPQLDSSRFLLGRPPWVGWQALRLLAHHLRLATRVESRAPVEVVNPRRRVCPCTRASLTGGSCRCLRSRRLRAGKRRALRTFRLRRLLILWSAMDTWARKRGVARRRLGLSSLTMLITVIAMLPRPLALRI